MPAVTSGAREGAITASITSWPSPCYSPPLRPHEWTSGPPGRGVAAHTPPFGVLPSTQPYLWAVWELDLNSISVYTTVPWFQQKGRETPPPGPPPAGPRRAALPSCQAPPEPRSQNLSLSCARGPRRLGTEPHETLATRLTLVLAAGAGLAGGWATPLRSWGDTRERGLGRARPRGQDVTPWL